VSPVEHPLSVKLCRIGDSGGASGLPPIAGMSRVRADFRVVPTGPVRVTSDQGRLSACRRQTEEKCQDVWPDRAEQDEVARGRTRELHQCISDSEVGAIVPRATMGTHLSKACRQVCVGRRLQCRHPSVARITARSAIMHEPQISQKIVWRTRVNSLRGDAQGNRITLPYEPS
jgi:hypothetical protein